MGVGKVSIKFDPKPLMPSFVFLRKIISLMVKELIAIPTPQEPIACVLRQGWNYLTPFSTFAVYVRGSRSPEDNIKLHITLPALSAAPVMWTFAVRCRDFICLINSVLCNQACNVPQIPLN
jgi:hypothetical protein